MITHCTYMLAHAFECGYIHITETGDTDMTGYAELHADGWLVCVILENGEVMSSRGVRSYRQAIERLMWWLV